MIKVIFVRFLATTLVPYISNPSSVNVPVLSKHMTVILPAILILNGLVQNIDFFFSLYKAIDTPICKQVGSAGGTLIVIRSRESITISSSLLPNSNLLGRVMKKPIKASNKNIATNFKES